MYAGVVAALQGSSTRELTACSWAAVVVVAGGLATFAAPSRARADEKPNTTVLETQGLAPPPPPRPAPIHYRLAILQQARIEARLYFPTGESAEPFVLFGAGLAGYGNEWSVATWGAGATIGGGLEVELSGGSLLNLSLAYRPIFLRSFEDSIPAFHEAGIVHFVTLEIALEAQDTL